MESKKRVASQSKAEPAHPVEPGLHLVLGDQGRILRSAPIRNAPRRFLQKPFLGPKTLRRITEPTSELVLDVLRSDGRVLDSFGWSWKTRLFVEQPLGKALANEGARARRFEAALPLRLLRVPVPAAATFLLFSRSDVDFKGSKPRAVKRRGLALYSLVSPIPRRPHLPVPAGDLQPQPLPFRTPLERSR